MTAGPPHALPSVRPARGLRIFVGLLVALFALAISALSGLGIYRIVVEAWKYRSWPSFGNVAFLLVLLLVAIPLWVLTIRLVRGRGYRDSAALLSPRALRLSAWTFLAWVLFVVWASIAVRSFAYTLLALPALALAIEAFRRARKTIP
jgi:hypothetical protein